MAQSLTAETGRASTVGDYTSRTAEKIVHLLEGSMSVHSIQGTLCCAWLGYKLAVGGYAVTMTGLGERGVECGWMYVVV